MNALKEVTLNTFSVGGKITRKDNMSSMIITDMESTHIVILVSRNIGYGRAIVDEGTVFIPIITYKKGIGSTWTLYAIE